MNQASPPWGTWATHSSDRSEKSAPATNRTSSPLRRLIPSGWVRAKRVKAAESTQAPDGAWSRRR